MCLASQKTALIAMKNNLIRCYYCHKTKTSLQRVVNEKNHNIYVCRWEIIECIKRKIRNKKRKTFQKWKGRGYQKRKKIKLL